MVPGGWLRLWLILLPAGKLERHVPFQMPNHDSLIGSPSSLPYAAKLATCANQEVKGAVSPSWEIDSKAVGMSNRSTTSGTIR